MDNCILSYVKINPQSFSLNGNLLYENAGGNFLEELYQKLKPAYPKFYKMDTLSKLGIIASELLLKNSEERNISVVLSNKSASLQTDEKYLKTTADFPSPSLFVYTLPNIVTGEICIKHKITGENIFFIEPRFNPDLLFSYTEIVMRGSEAVLCGWIESNENSYEAFVYLVTKCGKTDQKNSTFIGHSPEQINNLYNQ